MPKDLEVLLDLCQKLGVDANALVKESSLAFLRGKIQRDEFSEISSETTKIDDFWKEGLIKLDKEFPDSESLQALLKVWNLCMISFYIAFKFLKGYLFYYLTISG